MVADLALRPHYGRFMLTHLSTTTQLASRLRGRRVSAIRGRSLFWYDGHSASTRCPDCANVAHHLLDDMLLDIDAWRSIGGCADRIVSNLLASVGNLAPKNWLAQLMVSLAGSIPIVEMHAG